MNDKIKIRGEFVRHPTCGHLGCENDEMAFWQSRMTSNGERAEPIQLTNIRQLAKEIRNEVFTASNDADACAAGSSAS